MPLTRRLILQKARRHPPPSQAKRLRRIVSRRFQVLFHSPPGVLFTFPSRYSSAIGHQEVFRLTRWSWQIHSEFHGLAATRENYTQKPHTVFSRTGVSPSTPAHSRNLPLTPVRSPPRPGRVSTDASHNPHTATPANLTRYGFSLLRFRSPLLTESHVVFSSCGY
jgi:hypothetical protein